MFKHSKESGDYLGQIRNNADEKIELLDRAMASGELPAAETGTRRVVELGTGGGESLRKLKNKNGHWQDAQVIAVDILPGLAASLKKELDVEAVAADAGNLPFESNSISAVNASAIFHEISSYGTRAKGSETGAVLYGREAVEQTLGELNRVLLPDGLVCYRDVSAPREDMGKIKEVAYARKSWHQFSEWFTDDFLDSKPQFYWKDQVKTRENGSGFDMSAPAGFHRELQRHYLMMRDYLRNVKHQEFGITMVRADWIDQPAGLKSITFTISPELAAHLDLSGFESHASSEGNVYRGDSDQFDALYDQAIEKYFDALAAGGSEAEKFRAMIEEWQEREGHEHYLYGNITDLVSMAVASNQETGNGHVLLPRDMGDVQIAPRDYYNRYLRQAIDNPEEDGKQILALRKQTKAQAAESLDRIMAQEKAGEYFNLDTLRRLRAELAVA